MVEYIILIFMAVTILLLLWLRTNVGIVFLSLCAGSVLLAASGENFGLIASSITSGNQGSTNVAKIILLLVPVVVTSVMLRHQAPKSLFVFSFIISVTIAMLAAIFVVPLLSLSLQDSINSTDTWVLLLQYKELIVGLGLVVSLVMISMTVRRPHDKHGKHGKRHRRHR